jgi:AbiV family abortive infection protein
MEMLRGVASNAVRLAEDSRLLFARDRYESATALAVLSLEETGKYYLLSRKADDSALAAKLRNHVDKQKESAWFLVEAAILTFFELLGEHGYEHKRTRDLTPTQREWLYSPDGLAFDRSLRAGEWPAGIMDRVTDLLSARGVFDDFQTVQSGQLSRLKERGFYFDESDRPNRD